MKDPQKKKTFFASCPKGLEELLEQEISPFGEISRRSPAGRSFRATPEKAIQFLLQTRIASRVFLQIETYTFETQDELFEKAKDKWWHRVFRKNQSFKVESHTDLKSSKTFNNTLFLSRLLKDAIVDSFRDNTGDRPNVELKNPDIQLSLRIEKSKQKGFTALISLDLAGLPLSHRGYRKPGHGAPLRENLAAGLVMMTDWDAKKEVLLDPMCGSGTLLIEALMIKKDIPPSYLTIVKAFKNRKAPYAFFNHLWFQNLNLSKQVFDQMTEIVESSKEKLHAPSPVKVYGGDISQQSVDQTQDTLIELGVSEEDYELYCQSLFDWSSLPKTGILLTNPPYGKRLNLGMETEEFLHKWRNHLKKHLSQLRIYLISPKEEGLHLPFKAESKKKVYNGAIECQLLKYKVRRD